MKFLLLIAAGTCSWGYGAHNDASVSSTEAFRAAIQAAKATGQDDTIRAHRFAADFRAVRDTDGSSQFGEMATNRQLGFVNTTP